MAWTVYASPMSTADLTGTTKSARFTPPRNVAVDGFFTWLVLNNVGTFTSLVLKIYSDRSGSPGALIATSSTSYDKADILETYDNGMKYMGFQFATKQMLNKNTAYHLVLNCSDYTFSEDSHMAWVKAWPDPIYDQPATFNGLGLSSFMFGAIGADL